MNNLRGLVDSILVPHAAFAEASRRMAQCLDYAKQGAREPVCTALMGESRTGKSRCAEALVRKHRIERHDSGLYVPIMNIVVPALPTVKSLCQLHLRALGAPDWDKGTENAKTARLPKLMRECGTFGLILDEFHHFYDKVSHKVQHHVADWLKNLVGETKVALLVSGLPSLQSVIDQNEQLAGRFTSPILMPRFDWFNKAHRSEWISILGAFVEGLRSEFDLPALDGDDLALRTYCGTGGLIGYLTKTLRQAVWNAVDANSRVITLRDIEVAHQLAVWSHERLSHLPNPFDQTRLVYPTPELIAEVKLVGTPVIHAPVKQARTRVSRSPSSAGLVLAA